MLVSIFILQGCYLANGSPSESKFWVKNNNTKENESREMKYCSSKSIESLNESQRFYFENGEKTFFYGMRTTRKNINYTQMQANYIANIFMNVFIS